VSAVSTEREPRAIVGRNRDAAANSADRGGESGRQQHIQHNPSPPHRLGVAAASQGDGAGDAGADQAGSGSALPTASSGSGSRQRRITGFHAGLYMTADVEWHGGTVGTIEGRENVAGLFAGVVSSLPNVHAALEDAFGQGDEVVVRMVVSGTQTGPVLGIPATGRNIHWDAIDIFRLNGGKISAIWAGDDWTAVLYYTGTYTAPWIH
jgi:predicted ester cyclase